MRTNPIARWWFAAALLAFPGLATAYWEDPVAGASYPMVSFDGGQPLAGQPIGWFIANTFRMVTEYRDTTYTQQVDGTTIRVCVHRSLTSGTSVKVDYAVGSLPAMPAGDYTLLLSESTSVDGNLAPPCKQVLARPFVVLPASDVVTVVEYYNNVLDHYFITGDAVEIDALDRGLFAGWTRTGYEFGAFAGDAPSTPDLVPVCRYYGRPEAGLDTHFYSASAADCATVAQAWPDQWILETSSAFKVSAWAGRCPRVTRTYVRFYNDRPDVNHRYVYQTKSFTLPPPNPPYDEMIAKGWVLEGPAWCTIR